MAERYSYHDVMVFLLYLSLKQFQLVIMDFSAKLILAESELEKDDIEVEDPTNMQTDMQTPIHTQRHFEGAILNSDDDDSGDDSDDLGGNFVCVLV